MTSGTQPVELAGRCLAPMGKGRVAILNLPAGEAPSLELRSNGGAISLHADALEGALVSREELQRLVLSLALPHLDGPGGFSLGKDLHEIRDALRRPLPQPAIEHDEPQAVVVDRLLALDDRAFVIEGWTRDEDGTFTTPHRHLPRWPGGGARECVPVQKARRRGAARRGRAALQARLRCAVRASRSESIGERVDRPVDRPGGQGHRDARFRQPTTTRERAQELLLERFTQDAAEQGGAAPQPPAPGARAASGSPPRLDRGREPGRLRRAQRISRRSPSS